MSRLEFYSRPLVAFDPSNREHRRYCAEYLKFGGWGKCPVRFIVPKDTGMDLPTMIKNRLVEYYTSKEFKEDELFSREGPIRGDIGKAYDGRGKIT
jgi:hypothetical protein